jgi:hypothetical protein
MGVTPGLTQKHFSDFSTFTRTLLLQNPRLACDVCSDACGAPTIGCQLCFWCRSTHDED